MNEQPRQDQGSFTLTRTAVLIAVAVAVGGGFFSAAFFFNQWYVRVNTIPEEKILISLDSNVEDSSGPAKPSLQSDDSSDLTFFKNLTDKKSPYPTAPPTPLAPRKVAKPLPARNATVAEAPPNLSPPPATPPVTINPEKEPVQKAGLGQYTVQAGSFQSRSGAESLQKNLKAKGFSAYIVPVHMDNGSTWYRVRIGNALLRSDADALATKLQARTKLKPFVVLDK